MNLSDSTLSAYVRNELDENDIHTVEAVMAAEPHVARQAVLELLGARLGRQARLAVSWSPASQTFPEAERTTRRSYAVAAVAKRNFLPLTLAVLAVLLVSGAYLAGLSSRAGSGPLVIGTVGLSGLRTALATVPTGAEFETPQGLFRAVSSFKSSDKILCREFTLGNAAGDRHAVACRPASGWVVTFALFEPRVDDAYKLADGDDLTSGYLKRLGAGAPLSTAAERDALTAAQ